MMLLHLQALAETYMVDPVAFSTHIVIIINSLPQAPICIRYPGGNLGILVGYIPGLMMCSGHG